ncbi:MAG TPA: glycosyltransferase [Chitinophagaceae bacterium]|nr:glycosyltransferase [Chitinophagaceae bacterium]
MNIPAVSVILPAFNCGKYIGRAIESVLRQTFPDFELIIVNDGSTDNTEQVIQSYSDQRVIYVKNPRNQGLIHSLNRAIELSHSKYIARMDGDDICLPARLAKQKLFLDQNQDIAVVASRIEFINELEEKTGDWKLDKQTITPEQIKRTILKENCIAHPTVMMRAEIIKELKYKPYQKNIEDYDLWLRILSRGHKIAKIDEPLLLYRVHKNSITGRHLKNANPYFKHLQMKLKFLSKFGYAGFFSVAVLGSAMIDLARGIFKSIKESFRE